MLSIRVSARQSQCRAMDWAWQRVRRKEPSTLKRRVPWVHAWLHPQEPGSCVFCLSGCPFGSEPLGRRWASPLTRPLGRPGLKANSPGAGGAIPAAPWATAQNSARARGGGLQVSTLKRLRNNGARPGLGPRQNGRERAHWRAHCSQGNPLEGDGDGSSAARRRARRHLPTL